MEAALLELLLRQVPRCFVLVGLALPVGEQMAYGMPSCVASEVHAGGDASSGHKLGLDAQSSSLLPLELLGVSLHPLDLVLEGLDGIVLFQKATCESKRILGAHLVKVGDHRALLVNVGTQLLLLSLWSCVRWSSREATGRLLLLRCSSEARVTRPAKPWKPTSFGFRLSICELAIFAKGMTSFAQRGPPRLASKAVACVCCTMQSQRAATERQLSSSAQTEPTTPSSKPPRVDLSGCTRVLHTAL